ncbi:uncharacterized protein LOC126833594 [Adelges cooleyi]|uniref:uncharacterized protein LOC126833594 n=1 Tax=Adelges cooleyi TaxID=133065 RepID=UPI00217FE321|nr:uncharacterized protein LOC126833594 [Adelges cooleyi]
MTSENGKNVEVADDDSEIKSVHDAYQKELLRINNKHIIYLNKVEKYYKEQIISASKTNSSVSITFVETVQTLFQRYHRQLMDVDENYKSKLNALNEKLDAVVDSYQAVIQMYEKRQKSYINQILELKETIDKETKSKLNLLSKIVILENENAVLKSNISNGYTSKKKSMPEFELRFIQYVIVGILLWSLATKWYEEKSYMSIDHISIPYGLQMTLSVTVLLMFWNLVRFGKNGKLAIIASVIIICGIIYGSLLFFERSNYF